MSLGLGPVLYLPTGASGRWRLAYTKSDGTAADLTDATSIDFFVKEGAWLPDESRQLQLSLGDGLVVSDAPGGIVTATVSSAKSQLIVPYGNLFYFARATLADGSVIIPDGLRGTFVTDITAAISQAAAGANVLTIPPAQGNYPINRYDITSLTSGDHPLAAIDVDYLKYSEALVYVHFAGSISAIYRLRAKGTDTESAPWRVISTSDSDYLWSLLNVTKEGANCIWNPATEQFHQVIGQVVDGVLAQTVADTGFQLPL